ncbi:MAG TPA: hypothetical protein VMU51_08325 [Mycobacteriales bacterium]|nr:hypothetical protein [Mycobacteriales bacterium]
MRPAVQALSVLAAAAAIGSATVAAAPGAAAAGPPVITYRSCFSFTYAIDCEVHWSGGTDPATVAWASGTNSNVSGSRTDPVAHITIAGGNCVPATFYTVKITITDAIGQSVSATLPGRCTI